MRNAAIIASIVVLAFSSPASARHWTQESLAAYKQQLHMEAEARAAYCSYHSGCIRFDQVYGKPQRRRGHWVRRYYWRWEQ